MTYKLCLALIKARRTNGLIEKIDVFYAAGRLTTEEYENLVSLLTPTEDD